LSDFIVLYFVGLSFALVFATLVVRGRLEKSLKLTYNSTNASAGQGYSLSVALLEAEIARLALSDIQRRLRTKHSVQQFPARDLSFVNPRKKIPVALDGSAARRRV